MPVSKDWSDNFFSGLWLEFQRNAWSSEETARDAAIVESLAELRPAAKILDVPCGNGRIALELGRAGYQVTGVDLCEPLLLDGIKAADLESLPVKFEKKEMADLQWKNEFDAAFCWWGSIGYESESDDFNFFSAVLKSLKSGAVFILNSHTIETILANFEPRSFEIRGDLHVLEERYFDHITSRIETDWTFIHTDGKHEKKRSSMRLYTIRELTEVLTSAGFSDVEVFEGVELTQFEIGDALMTLRAVKS